MHRMISSGNLGYTSAMELHLTPETEAKLNDLAQRTLRGTDELLEEAMCNGH